MINNLEQRVYRLEQDVVKLRQQVDDILRRLAALEQRQYSNGGSGMGGSGGGGGYYDCTLGSALTAESSTTGEVSQRTGSGRSVVADSATIYSDAPTDIDSGKTVILTPNPDGSYTVIGVYC